MAEFKKDTRRCFYMPWPAPCIGAVVKFPKCIHSSVRDIAYTGMVSFFSDASARLDVDFLDLRQLKHNIHVLSTDI